MKRVFLSTLVFIGMVLLSGCSNSSQPSPDQIVKKEKVERDVVYQRKDLTRLEREKRLFFKIYGDGDKIPKWIKEPRLGSKEFKVLAVGTAGYMANTSDRLYAMKNFALYDAQVKLSQLLTIVSKIINNSKAKGKYTIGDKNEYKRAINLKSDIKTDVSPSGIIPLKYTVTEDGTLHYLVALSPTYIEKYYKLKGVSIQKGNKALDEAKKHGFENMINSPNE